MFISSSTIICLHYATNYENLWLYHIGVAQTQIQPSPLTHKAPSRPQSYSHLLHILAYQCLLFLTPPPHPSAWLCKFCYQAYRWILLYYFHTLISFQVRTIIPHDAENFRHLLHRRIVPWRKLPFLVYNQSTTTLHSSHVMRPSPKSSHSFGTHELSLLLDTIFLHQFVGLSFIILKFLLWTSLCFVHKLQRDNPLRNSLLASH